MTSFNGGTDEKRVVPATSDYASDRLEGATEDEPDDADHSDIDEDLQEDLDDDEDVRLSDEKAADYHHVHL